MGLVPKSLDLSFTEGERGREGRKVEGGWEGGRREREGEEEKRDRDKEKG